MINSTIIGTSVYEATMASVRDVQILGPGNLILDLLDSVADSTYNIDNIRW